MSNLLLGTLTERVNRAFDEFVQGEAWLPAGFNPMPMLEGLRAAILQALPPAPPQEQEQGLCLNGAKHYCPNCDRSFVAAFPPAQEQAVRPTEQPPDHLGLGRLLLNEYGRKCYQAGRESVAAPAQAQEP